ncbi:MAG: transposase [Candidatus Moranbacteria bacterium]|nr:transposase [Candidatus Moranbacteria bacterium]
MRKEGFYNGEYYHIYNRGVDKREIFLNEQYFRRFLLYMRKFNNKYAPGGLYEEYLRNKKKDSSNEDEGGRGGGRGSASTLEAEPLPPSQDEKIVEIIAYCLNPNHFHLLLKQKEEGGISSYMQKIGTGFTMFFNKKNDRSGSLFQGRYKSVHIDTNEYLLYLSAYINCNNFIHGYNNSPEDWLYSSYLDFIGRREGILPKKSIILEQFDNSFKDYKKFCKMNMEYLKDRKEMQKYLLE